MSKPSSANTRYLACLLAVCLPLNWMGAGAAVSLTGQCEVNLLRGTTTIGKGIGSTEQQAWSSCIAQIPQPSTATSGTVSYTCQTPKCKYVATYSPDPPPATATLTWGTPVVNEAGPITGYRIEYAGQSYSVGLVNVRVFTNLAPGTHCFTVRTVTATQESDPTDPVCKVI